MTWAELSLYLVAHPDCEVCPNCGGAGWFPLPVLRPGRDNKVECGVCHGAGVVKKGEV